MPDRGSTSLKNGGERLEFEALMTSLASGFLNMPPHDLDREVQNGLRQVCELLGADLSVLWQWSVTAPDVILPTHSYSALPEFAPTDPLGQEQYPWTRQQVLAGRAFAIGSVTELPEEASVDRESCLQVGIKSAVCVPLSISGGRPVGALAFNCLREERAWSKQLVSQVQMLAQLFAAALSQKRHEQVLQESEARMRLAAESAGAGLWTLEYETGAVWASAEARTIFGYEPEQVVDLELLKSSIHPEDIGLVLGAIERSRASDQVLEVDYRVRQANDGVRWVNSRGRRQTAGATEPWRLMGVSIDITARKLAEEEFRRSQVRLDSATAIAGLAFYEVNFQTGSAYVDSSFREICGVAVERDEGLHALEYWIEHLHEDDREAVLELREEMHAGTRPTVSTEYRYLHPQHGVRWIQHRAGVSLRDAGGRAVVTYGVLRDITERRELELAMRDLSRRLIRAHEEDRAILARELHDDVTQRLAVMAIELGRAERGATDPEQVGAMTSVREGLVRLSEDVHSLAYQLHPAVLEELGLSQALEAECERLRRSGSLDAAADLEPLVTRIGRDEALCLFRVAQEALNNVRRHAGVQEATLSLRDRDGGVFLAVRDTGAGFVADLPGGAWSLGLASMRERVRAVGGTLDIQSAPGQGTMIEAWVPGQGGER